MQKGKGRVDSGTSCSAATRWRHHHPCAPLVNANRRDGFRKRSSMLPVLVPRQVCTRRPGSLALADSWHRCSRHDRKGLHSCARCLSASSPLARPAVETTVPEVQTPLPAPRWDSIPQQLTAVPSLLHGCCGLPSLVVLVLCGIFVVRPGLATYGFKEADCTVDYLKPIPNPPLIDVTALVECSCGKNCNVRPPPVPRCLSHGPLRLEPAVGCRRWERLASRPQVCD